MEKYSEEFKIKLVTEYLDGKIGYRTAKLLYLQQALFQQLSQ